MRLLFFQYGDFGEAYRRFAEGGDETYRDQRNSVDFVASLRGRFQVTTVSVGSASHEIELAPELWSIGVREAQAFDYPEVERLLGRLKPDLIVCRTPNRHVMRWARRHHRPSLLSFADYFRGDGLRMKASNFVLGRELTSDVFPCVSNHSLNASMSVARTLRYPKSRIVPWEWNRLIAHPDAKSALSSALIPTGFFAGMLMESKGVGDCLDAVAKLDAEGTATHFEFAGPGDTRQWLEQARRLQIQDKVEFIGSVSNTQVRERMRAADFVVVPSRHDYAEGLPNTIYEALASRTPLIVSDHPSFASRLEDGKNSLIFQAASSESLADKIAALVKTPQLYASLSHGSAAALAGLYVGMSWRDLVSKFLDDPANNSRWVEANSLSALGY